MKELSIEEKAKRYDELKVTAQELEEDGCFDKITLFDLFPELKESEDERIRKELFKHLKEGADGYEPAGNSEDYKRWLGWLEKQGEQKPVWSEEDENMVNRLIAYFEDKESFTAEDDIVYANWLKSLKDRVQPQPKQEWSEEDKRKIGDIRDAITLDKAFSNPSNLRLGRQVMSR